MTVPSTARRAGPYTGNGSTTTFSFSFKTFAAGDLLVTRTASSGVETTLVLNSDYSVSLNVDQDASPGGTITYPISGSPLPAGQKLTIVGDLEYEQTTDLLGGGAFNARVIEDTFDRATIQIQQLEERLDRAAVLPVSVSGVSATLPDPEASKVLGWNVTETGLVNIDASSLASVTASAYVVVDKFTGDGSTTQFVCSQLPGSTNAAEVTIAGVMQNPAVDYTVSGARVVFTAPPPNGAVIIVRFLVAASQSSGAAFTTERHIATSGQSVFTLANAYAPGADTISVFINGVLMTSVIDYAETSANVVTFVTGLSLNDEVVFHIWRTTVLSTADSANVSYTPAGSGAVQRTVQSKLRDVVSVKDFGAVGDGVADDTVAIQAAIDASLLPGVGYKMVWLPTGIYRTTSPLLLPANYRLDGDDAIIKAGAGFTGVTRTNVGGGGTVTLNCLLLFLLGDFNDISGPQRDRAFIGRGITLDCDEQINCGVYIERMPYSDIQCKVMRTTAGGNAIDVGPYCWGTALRGVVVEDFSENAIALGAGCNGITIDSPRIWGKSKTGASGVLIKASSNVNGVAIVGGFIEKLDYGLYVARGNGPISVDGTDFEVCTTNCVRIQGNGADVFRATVSLRNCYLESTGTKVYATSGIVTVDACRLRSGNDFETAAPGGFISSTNNQYESGFPTIAAGSNVSVDVEQAWTPVLLDDSLSPSEGQSYAVQNGTFNRVGNKVFFRGFIQLSSLGTLTGVQTARVGGLPFVSSNSSNTHSVVSVGYAASMSIGAANALTGYVGVGVNYFNMQKFSATSGTQDLTINEISASGLLIFSGSYVV